MTKQKTPITDKNGKQTHVWKRIGDALSGKRSLPKSSPVQTHLIEVSELRQNDLVLENGEASVVSVVPSKTFPDKVSINLSDGRSILASEGETIKIVPSPTAVRYNTYADVSRAIEFFHGIYQADANGGRAYGAISQMSLDDLNNALVVGAELMYPETSSIIVNGDDQEVRLGEFIEAVNDTAYWDGIDKAREYAGSFTLEQRTFFLYDIATSRKTWNRGELTNG